MPMLVEEDDILPQLRPGFSPYQITLVTQIENFGALVADKQHLKFQVWESVSKVY